MNIAARVSAAASGGEVLLVDPDHAAGRLSYDGTTYFFCALTCAGVFAQDPQRYAG